MSDRQDCKYEFLVGSGYSGSNQDMERAYLTTLGTTPGAIHDMWDEYWDAYPIAEGTYGDRARLFLIAEGGTLGAVGDMWTEWWCAKLAALP